MGARCEQEYKQDECREPTAEGRGLSYALNTTPFLHTPLLPHSSPCSSSCLLHHPLSDPLSPHSFLPSVYLSTIDYRPHVRGISLDYPRYKTRLSEVQVSTIDYRPPSIYRLSTIALMSPSRWSSRSCSRLAPLLLRTAHILIHTYTH